MIYLTPKPNQSFFVNRIQRKEKSHKKELFKEKWEWRIEQKKQTKRRLFNCFCYGN